MIGPFILPSPSARVDVDSLCAEEGANATSAASLAPWVVTHHAPDGLFAIGARLKLIRAQNLAAVLNHENEVLRKAFRCPAGIQEIDVRQDQDPAVLIVNRSTSPHLCAAVQLALHERGIRSAIYHRDAPAGVPAFVLHDHEPRVLDPVLDAVLQTREIIWSFDSTVGTAIGPLLRSVDDFASYSRSTSAFVEDRLVDELFPNMRPCSLGALSTDPVNTAAAIENLLNEGQVGVVWVSSVDGISRKRLSDSATDQPVPLAARDELVSPFGICRNVTHEKLASPLGDIYISSCRSPAGGVYATLEGNSGKAFRADQAPITMFGEAVERSAAFFANRATSAPVLADDEPLVSFAPFGDLWTARELRGDDDERIIAHDFIDGSPVSVPKVLVAYPYVPPPGLNRPSRADTTGLAAYPVKAGAVLRGLREILERDSLYTNFLHQRRGFRFAPQVNPTYTLQMVWYPDCPFPAVHAFVIANDPPSPLVGRGSGSGLTWESAREGAIVESFQILEQMRRGTPDHEGSAYMEWREPDVQAKIFRYIESMPVTEPPRDLESSSEDEQLTKVAHDLALDAQRVLVVDLPSPVLDLFAVRVLVPGRATNIHSRHGHGGTKLVGASWQHSFPV